MAKPFVEIKLEGFDDLEAALKELPNSTAKSTLRSSLKKAAQPIAEQASSLAPRRTGRLSEGIVVKTQLSKRQKKRRRRQGDVEMFVGAIYGRSDKAAPHAHLVEFGTSKMGARPFLRPAWDAGKDRLLDSMKKELFGSIRRRAKRLAKKAGKT